jgi:CBS domain containing-hemolysin-like protein
MTNASAAHRGCVRLLFAIAAACVSLEAHASFLSGDTLDTVAMYAAWFIILVVPIVAIGLFLIVHVLPEKIAEHRHHPQQGAIKTLCFLSLVFGGMLWPLAWLWAFTRPVGFRMAYGTEKHEHYFVEMGERAARGELDALELEHLRDELAEMSSRGTLPAAIRGLPAILAQAQPRAAPAAAPAATPAAAAAGRSAGGPR